MDEIFTLNFYVSPNGSDKNLGTKEQPFATISRAKEAVFQSKQMHKGPVNVWIRGGTNYLNEPLVFVSTNSGTEDGKVSYAAYPGEKVTISGGKKLNCNWYPYQGGIWRCELSEAREGKLDFTQLFVNGKRQIRARYPNYDHSDPKNYSGYIRAAGPLPDDITQPQP